MGDNLTGAGEGDDEQMKIDLSKVPAQITKIAFTVTIYEPEQRRQNFGQINNAFIRIYNEDTGEEMLRYDLGEDFSIETAAVFGEVYKNGSEWKFNAIGSGYQGGLKALCAQYGVDDGRSWLGRSAKSERRFFCTKAKADRLRRVGAVIKKREIMR